MQLPARPRMDIPSKIAGRSTAPPPTFFESKVHTYVIAGKEPLPNEIIIRIEGNMMMPLFSAKIQMPANFKFPENR